MKKKKMAMKEQYLSKMIINQNKINICKINCSSISPENQSKYRKDYSHQEAKTQSQQMPQIL
jgi:phage gp16-like protein